MAEGKVVNRHLGVLGGAPWERRAEKAFKREAGRGGGKSPPKRGKPYS